MNGDGGGGADAAGGNEPDDPGSSDRRGDVGDTPTVSIGEGGFRPGGGDGHAQRDDSEVQRDEGTRTTAGLEDAVVPPAVGFDWGGWLLVAVLVLSFLVVPAFVALRPFRINDYQTTYLLLPLLPAFVLGATAVWVAVRSRQG